MCLWCALVVFCCFGGLLHRVGLKFVVFVVVLFGVLGLALRFALFVGVVFEVPLGVLNWGA